MSVAKRFYYFEDGSVLDDNDVEKQSKTGLAVMFCEEYEEAERVQFKAGKEVAWGHASFDTNLDDESRFNSSRTNVTGKWEYVCDVVKNLQTRDQKTWAAVIDEQRQETKEEKDG